MHSRMTQLRDAHLLVVGATGGLGSAICRRLANEGSCLTLAGRNEAKIAALMRELGQAVVKTVSADLSVPGGPAAVATTAAGDGRIDGVLYTASVVAFGPLEEIDDDNTFDELLLVLLNSVAPVRLLRS